MKSYNSNCWRFVLWEQIKGVNVSQINDRGECLVGLLVILLENYRYNKKKGKYLSYVLSGSDAILLTCGDEVRYLNFKHDTVEESKEI